MIPKCHGFEANKLKNNLKRRSGFDFIFPDLQSNPQNLLPVNSTTIKALKALGGSMAGVSSNATSNISAVYTYFGQFIDHDITNTNDRNIVSNGVDDVILSPNFKPLSRKEIQSNVENIRTAKLDLDSLYDAPAPKSVDGKKMILGEVSKLGSNDIPLKGIPTSDDRHDLKRMFLISNPKTDQEKENDRKALIGDERNDENLIIAQLHVSLLRAHNKLVDRDGLSFKDAQRGMRRRYQSAILNDFLKNVCDPKIVDTIIAAAGICPQKTNNFKKVFIPVEFTMAAYRFGHSMVRNEYDYNRNFPKATLQELFTFTALSGDMGKVKGLQVSNLPDNWIIEWDRFLPHSSGDVKNKARNIDTILTPELHNLRNVEGSIMADILSKLATRNLLRGYRFSMPTGQAVCRFLGFTPMTSDQILGAVSSSVKNALLKNTIFIERTPLWLYVLTEANFESDGKHLGQVGSTIVAKTLWNLIAHSDDNIIKDPVHPNEFPKEEGTVAGLIKLGVSVPV